jgi:hypothetical protein
MSNNENNEGKNKIIGAVLIGLVVVYFIFKYLGDWLGYGLLLIAVLHIPYNYFIKNFTKQTMINSGICFGLAMFSFTLSYFFNYSDCGCYKLYLKSSVAQRGVDEINWDGIEECEAKWNKEVIKGDYQSTNKAVYSDPIQYFGEKCDDKE